MTTTADTDQDHHAPDPELDARAEQHAAALGGRLDLAGPRFAGLTMGALAVTALERALRALFRQ